jgi:hypothetical protein
VAEDDVVINLSRPISVEATIELQDVELHDRLAAVAAEVKGEVVGGRWDGLPVRYEPETERPRG